MSDADADFPARNVLLMGLRGSGKSTLGRLLAERMAIDFVDLDDLTIRRLGGATVAEVWERVGEDGFRAAEAEALADAMMTPGRIIALGGGTPTAPGASDFIHAEVKAARATAVYLRAQPQTLRTRLEQADNSDRPSLTGAGTLAEIEQMFLWRDGLYRDLAPCVIETDDMDDAGVLAAIESAVGA